MNKSNRQRVLEIARAHHVQVFAERAVVDVLDDGRPVTMFRVELQAPAGRRFDSNDAHIAYGVADRPADAWRCALGDIQTITQCDCDDCGLDAEVSR